MTTRKPSLEERRNEAFRFGGRKPGKGDAPAVKLEQVILVLASYRVAARGLAPG